MEKSILLSMRSIILTCVILLGSNTSNSKETNDSLRLNKLEVRVDTIDKNIVKIKTILKNEKTKCRDCDLNLGEWTLVFSPVFLFLIAVYPLSLQLKDFKLAEALSENDPVKNIVKNDLYSVDDLIKLGGSSNASIAGNIATILSPTRDQITNTYRASSSRYIAFITSSLAWIITLALTCFFIYRFIATGDAPDLTKFATVLISLGVGVVPYAFNKLSSINKPS